MFWLLYTICLIINIILIIKITKLFLSRYKDVDDICYYFQGIYLDYVDIKKRVSIFILIQFIPILNILTAIVLVLYYLYRVLLVILIKKLR